MTAAIINPQMPNQLISEATDITVGPSAPPIIPMEADSLPQPLKHNVKSNVRKATISFFIESRSFISQLYHTQPETSTTNLAGGRLH